MKIKLKKNILANLSADVDVVPVEQTNQIQGGLLPEGVSSPCASDVCASEACVASPSAAVARGANVRGVKGGGCPRVCNRGDLSGVAG